ncbi:helix-turn-helix transcriptional regulator [Cohnella yongneupensis]|uniref:Helix-turn-helix domain-containing protein n=1 Tax=Cohnella yongneupensis TaxID=425006 RepID=A0ABW0R527_9BACL
MEFVRTALAESLKVDQLISFHYFEYANGFVFDGEQHDFWELLYVDKGSVEVRADDRTYELKQGHMIFHKPDEFHTVRVQPHHKPPNLVVISFECASPGMNALQDLVLTLSDADRHWLSLAVQEGFRAFAPPFDDPSEHRLIRNPEAPFGSEQLMRSYLEILLISLVRACQTAEADKPSAKLTNVYKTNFEQELSDRIVDYLRRNLSEPLSLEVLCKQFHVGKSRLKQIFHDRFRCGIMEYYRTLKFEEAKTLIREQKYNLTEISARLGYSSIHYFSREFKKNAGMSPSEYAKTVKMKTGMT